MNSIPSSIDVKRGIIISKLMVGFARIACQKFLQDSGGAALGDAMICAAIFVAHAESKLTNARGLAEYVGMPRATVVRRLRSLQERKMIVEDAPNAWRIATENKAASDRLMAGAEACEQMLRQATRDLSILDNEEIAQ